MKLTSKHSLILACVVTATVAACRSGRRDDATVDVWASGGGRPAHARSAAANGTCTPGGPDRSGWELRLDGAAGDAIRRVDLQIPRAESAGTASFYAGVTTMRDGVLSQWVVETRAQAAHPTGEGRTEAEYTENGVSVAIISRSESDWYFITARCPASR